MFHGLRRDYTPIVAICPIFILYWGWTKEYLKAENLHEPFGEMAPHFEGTTLSKVVFRKFCKKGKTMACGV